MVQQNDTTSDYSSSGITSFLLCYFGKTNQIVSDETLLYRDRALFIYWGNWWKTGLYWKNRRTQLRQQLARETCSSWRAWQLRKTSVCTTQANSGIQGTRWTWLIHNYTPKTPLGQLVPHRAMHKGIAAPGA